ncbi:hypothetical protein [Streptomyces sp. 7-21]|jgi:hypothetical protein|uniref:hypothetical protein n=1 Tax=Streptomyces sp. 7-21 TaxID=2802283 RepID=UPI0019201CAE|nr:hypothetical protein [Streptomyces sp. 7-21]MBL1067312.1 hypothetical protein [Streptomyces sp. 7-21]
MAHSTSPDTSRTPDTEPAPEGRGCLFALSQPPLILFLTVIGGLLLITGLHDQFLL